MVSPIGSNNISAIQLFNANHAFNIKPSNSTIENDFLHDTSGTHVNSVIMVKSEDVEEIKKYAKMAGENISEDDIMYGLNYGRSVIADYMA